VRLLKILLDLTIALVIQTAAKEIRDTQLNSHFADLRRVNDLGAMHRHKNHDSLIG
jgi:hypothetical protein